MVDPFVTLGIEPAFDVDLTAVEKQYRELSRVLHPDRHVGSSAGERRMSLGKAVEVNDAWRVVRDPVRRAEALLRHLGAEVKEGQEPKPDPEFLMDMMEQREALAEARAQKSAAAVARLAEEIKKRESAATARLAAGFAANIGAVADVAARDANAGHAARATDVGARDANAARTGSAGGAKIPLAKLSALLGELRYYRRFLDEVSAIEDAFSEESAAPSQLDTR